VCAPNPRGADLNDDWPPGGRTIYVAQGEIAVDDHPDTVITTLLGSCVSVCLHDPIAMLGGMNHILLPDEAVGSVTGQGDAINAMEMLVNPLLKRGARKSRMQAKVFGGASFSGVFGDIGVRNIDFVMRYLGAEGIACIGQSLGGRSARRIKFWPASGRVQQKLVRDEPVEIPTAAGTGNAPELF